MRVALDHFGEVVLGAGEGEGVLGGEGARGGGGVQGLFVADGGVSKWD